MQTAQDALEAMADTELVALSAPNTDADKAIDNWWNSFLDPDISTLRSKRPPPLAFGLCHPVLEPDYEYWAKMRSVTLHEATFLTVGCRPDFLTKEELAKIASDPPKKLYPSVAFLLKRLELMRNHFAYTGPGYQFMSLDRFKELIDEIALPVPKKLSECLIEREERLRPSSATDEPAPHSWSQERKTLLKLIAGLAVGGYGFDPRASRSSVPSEVSADLDLIGLSLDVKTVREKLKEAGGLIHEDYWRQ